MERFTPLRPAPRRRLLLGIVVGPFLWLSALVVVAVVVHRTNAIGLGILIAFGALVLSTIVLLLVRAGRDREQRRYAPPS